MPLPMFEKKNQGVGILQRKGEPDLEVKVEVESGSKKLSGALKKQAEKLLHAAKNKSVIEMAKAIRKMKLSKKKSKD